MAENDLFRQGAALALFMLQQRRRMVEKRPQAFLRCGRPGLKLYSFNKRSMRQPPVFED